MTAVRVATTLLQLGIAIPLAICLAALIRDAIAQYRITGSLTAAVLGHVPDDLTPTHPTTRTPEETRR